MYLQICQNSLRKEAFEMYDALWLFNLSDLFLTTILVFCLHDNNHRR